MLKKMCMAGLMLMAFVLSGCALQSSPTGQFGTVPVAAKDFTVYQCTAAKETFVHYQPQIGKLQLLPFSASITENGATWHASYPGGDIQSPQMYKDLLGKIDGSVDANGVRYYRVHLLPNKAPTFSYSTVNPITGDGEGMTFFQCSVAPEQESTAIPAVAPAAN